MLIDAPPAPVRSIDADAPLDSETDLQPAASAEPVAQDQTNTCGFFQVFLSAFCTVFLAELGDKTQLATLLMSAESHAPWVVFAGAGTALIATSLVGVLLGRWLAGRLSPRTLELATGAILLLVAVQLFWEVL